MLPKLSASSRTRGKTATFQSEATTGSQLYPQLQWIRRMSHCRSFCRAVQTAFSLRGPRFAGPVSSSANRSSATRSYRAACLCRACPRKLFVTLGWHARIPTCRWSNSNGTRSWCVSGGRFARARGGIKATRAWTMTADEAAAFLAAGHAQLAFVRDSGQIAIDSEQWLIGFVQGAPSKVPKAGSAS
jgi:hypothetical protein